VFVDSSFISIWEKNEGHEGPRKVNLLEHRWLIPAARKADWYALGGVGGTREVNNISGLQYQWPANLMQSTLLPGALRIACHEAP
jgi:hypothetical protein